MSRVVKYKRFYLYSLSNYILCFLEGEENPELEKLKININRGVQTYHRYKTTEFTLKMTRFPKWNREILKIKITDNETNETTELEFLFKKILEINGLIPKIYCKNVETKIDRKIVHHLYKTSSRGKRKKLTKQHTIEDEVMQYIKQVYE